MRDLGYVYGKHFVTEPRGDAGRPERHPNLAAELVGLQVDMIVVSGPTLRALKQTTSTIPWSCPVWWRVGHTTGGVQDQNVRRRLRRVVCRRWHALRRSRYRAPSAPTRPL
jgi:hypothetical protein